MKIRSLSLLLHLESSQNDREIKESWKRNSRRHVEKENEWKESFDNETSQSFVYLFSRRNRSASDETVRRSLIKITIEYESKISAISYYLDIIVGCEKIYSSTLTLRRRKEH